MPQISDTVLISCMLLPGATLLILGIYSAIKVYRLKEIASFPLMQDAKTVKFPKTGSYCLIVAGGNNINKLPLRIVSHATNKGIDAYSVVPAPRLFKKGSIAVTYCRFIIEDAGHYEIIIKDYNAVVVQFRFPGPVGLVANSTVPPQSLKLVVEEHVSGFMRATSIIGTIIGVLLIMFGTIFLLNNHGINTPSKSETTTITTYRL